MKDMTERRKFHDAVVEEHREIDAHYQRKMTGSPYDFLSKALFHKTGGLYFVPFRCLIAKGLDNLMMAGPPLMGPHLADELTLQQFADVIAYIQSMKRE